MKSKIIAWVVCVFLLASGAFGTIVTEIRYTAGEIGPGRWQYDYEVSNVILTGPIEEFTIWFDYGLYENLAIETPNPPASGWDEIVVQPEPIIKDDGYYDALTLDTGIGVGQTVVGFAVSFDWLGVGEPGSQFYEIIDPVTFDTIDSGWTVPEPGTLILLGLGMLALHNRQKKEEK